MSLTIYNSEEYYQSLDNPKEIDWDELGDPNKVSMVEEDLLSKILTCEASIYLLRNTAGGYGHLADNMIAIRRDFIDEFNDKYGTYVSFNDFY